jgi:hypothetical protein
MVRAFLWLDLWMYCRLCIGLAAVGWYIPGLYFVGHVWWLCVFWAFQLCFCRCGWRPWWSGYSVRNFLLSLRSVVKLTLLKVSHLTLLNT